MNKMTEVPIILLEYLVNQATEARQQIEILSKFNADCTSQISELKDLADFNKRSSQENLELYKNQLEETKKLKEELAKLQKDSNYSYIEELRTTISELMKQIASLKVEKQNLENYKESFQELQYKHSNLMQNYDKLEEHIVNRDVEDANETVTELIKLDSTVNELKEQLAEKCRIIKELGELLVQEKEILNAEIVEKDKQLKELNELIAKGPKYIIKYYYPITKCIGLAVFNSSESLRIFLHENENYTVEELWIYNTSREVPYYYKQDITISTLGMPLTAWLLNLEVIENE